MKDEWMQQIDIPPLAKSLLKYMAVFDQAAEPTGQQSFRMFVQSACHLGY